MICDIFHTTDSFIDQRLSPAHYGAVFESTTNSIDYFQVSTMTTWQAKQASNYLRDGINAVSPVCLHGKQRGFRMH